MLPRRPGNDANESSNDEHHSPQPNVMPVVESKAPLGTPQPQASSITTAQVQQTKNLWFDVLNPALLKIIATHVAGGKLHKTSGCLANSSLFVPDTVAFTAAGYLATTFLLESDARAYNRRWGHVFRDSAGEVASYPGSGYDMIQAFIAAPTIRILPFPYAGLKRCSVQITQKLRSLSIYGSAKISMRWYEEVFRLATTIPLICLSIHCASGHGPTCMFNISFPDADDLSNPSRLSWPSMRSLSLICTCEGLHRSSFPSDFIHKELPRMPNLKFLTASFGLVENATLDTSVENVALRAKDMRAGAARLAINLGARATGLVMPRELDEELLRGLTLCVRIRKLDICIAPGTEWVLVQALERMYRMTSLSLAWSPHGGKAYVAPKGLMLRVVKAAAGLKQLRIRHVVLEIEEVETMLEAIGPRLQKLGVPVLEAGMEDPFSRLARLVSSVLRHARSIKVLSTDLGMRAWNGKLRALASDGTAGRVEQGQTLRRLVDRLLRHHPAIEATSVAEACKYFRMNGN